MAVNTTEEKDLGSEWTFGPGDNYACRTLDCIRDTAEHGHRQQKADCNIPCCTRSSLLSLIIPAQGFIT